MNPLPSDEQNLPHKTILARATEELHIVTAAHARLFQIDRADWHLNQDTGLITFTSPSGIIATAPAQIVGSLNTAEGTWLWAWENSSIDPPLAAHAEITRQYGQERGLTELTTPLLRGDEGMAWEFTALTCKLGKHQGAYRGPTGDLKTFITYGNVTLQKRK